MADLALDGLEAACFAVEGRAFSVVEVRRRMGAGLTGAHAAVVLHAEPALRVYLSLLHDWNGRLVTQGNGGFVGEGEGAPHRNGFQAEALATGFAVAMSNGGHDAGAASLAHFARDPNKLLDFAHRGIHHTVLVARQVATAVYGCEPAFRYYQGCSKGGRQELMAAQRYPGDFHGIVAGCPVLDFVNTQLWGVYTAQALDGAGVDDAVMAAITGSILGRFADHNGGDPLIIDPLATQIDVFRDLPVGDDEACAGGGRWITRAQAEALARVYAPADLGGRGSFTGQPVGAEPAGSFLPGDPVASGWSGWFYEADGGLFAGAAGGVRATFGEAFLREILGHPGTWRDFDFSPPALARADEASALLDATQTDLSPFVDGGGKLLIYHGAADAANNPARTAAYVDAVRQEMGARADDFLRFYLQPGVFHCWGGYGPDSSDFLGAMVAWVERGEVPATLIASYGQGGREGRPLAPYPVGAYE